MAIAPTAASTFEVFDITSADGSQTVSLIGGITKLQYFETLMSPMCTAVVDLVNTGNTINGQGIYNGLPIRGGERVYFKVKTPVEAEGEQEEHLESVLYVNKITNVIANKGVETLTLHLVAREGISNEQSRVTRKFYGQTIDQSVTDIVKLVEPLKQTEFEKCENIYNFIGNLRKPFTILLWLASKAIPVGATSRSAGFFFWQTRKGFHFKSVENMIKEAVDGKDKLQRYFYSQSLDPSLEDSFQNAVKILAYSVRADTDVLADLNSGVHSTYRIFFNPVSFEFTQPQNSVFKEKPASQLGVPEEERPLVADPENIPGNMMASRIISQVYDVGSLEVGVSTAINYDPVDSTSQAITRYGMLFNTQLSLTIPTNTDLVAGDAIMLYFPKTTDDEPEIDDRISGIYIIKDLTHIFLPNSSYTSAVVVRDSHGLYPQS
tara:strand:+ start:135 stop:1439 length:1305 start_codon:yes stop_codon:yes gene_type:complete